ncbi:23S rRNA (uracil(1939)-C(5))-methyltransferase RlmD [Natranaerobius thermophilus]|uniref:RNA methyltransferase, TrmA family n=1 Tax=Natranaerobius thermophilus (strain ATCC BAA-1301 / DSM 18059 / JW/NM-WN-LF) TaxID=457570 RepID=B2A5X0_NATTJ|nr:23S rRNA (uracil(1939)-C(5))-methyltransferase RlmD [Natranaerobius thermophilus]ACB84063.1 RNA methyltransferase, TrmA family [Natranaerobius thermophilus JW/NM-WN-LF]
MPDIRPVKKEEKLTLTIHDLNHQGEGVGKYRNFAIFVPFALPGEKVRITITEVKKNYARGQVLQHQDRSSQRVKPPCPFFQECGGCQLQHLSYKGQLQYKENLVANQMKKVAGLKNPRVLPAIGMESPWYYRNKFQIPVKPIGGKPRLGLFQKRSQNLVEIDHCMIQKHGNNEVLEKMRNLVDSYEKEFYNCELKHIISRVGDKTDQVQLTFVTGSEKIDNKQMILEPLKNGMANLVGIVQNINKKPRGNVLGDRFKTLWGREYLMDNLLDKKFRVSAGAFYQVNPSQTEVLYQKVFELCKLKGVENVMDIYCGIGTISLLAAENASKVVGIEIAEEAVKDANINKNINGQENAWFYQARAEDEKTESIIQDYSPEIVIMDPPRKGCDENLLTSLDWIRPEKIAYVSCNPATLARDVGKLIEFGYYPELFQPVDMFPQTTHIEVICILTKIDYL